MANELILDLRTADDVTYNEVFLDSEGGIAGIILGLEYYYSRFYDRIMRRDTNTLRPATLQELSQLRDEYQTEDMRAFINLYIESLPIQEHVQPMTAVQNQGQLIPDMSDPSFFYSQQGPGFAPSAQPQMPWTAAVNQEFQLQNFIDNGNHYSNYPDLDPEVLIQPVQVNAENQYPLGDQLGLHGPEEEPSEPNDAAHMDMFGPDIPLPPFPPASPAHSARESSPEPRDAAISGLFAPDIPLPPPSQAPPAQPASAESSPQPRDAVLRPQNQDNRIHKAGKKGNKVPAGPRRCRPGSCVECKASKSKCKFEQSPDSCDQCLKLGKTCNIDGTDKRTNNSMRDEYRKAYHECKKYHSDLVLLCNELINSRRLLSPRAIREIIDEYNPKLWFAVCFGPDLDPKTCEQVEAYRGHVGLHPDGFSDSMKLEEVRAKFKELIEETEKEVGFIGFYLTLLTSDNSFDWAVEFWKYYMQGRSHDDIKQGLEERNVFSTDNFNLIPSLTARVTPIIHKYHVPRPERLRIQKPRIKRS